ncbi:MAG: porin family protein [Chitinophagales bacterium]
MRWLLFILFLLTYTSCLLAQPGFGPEVGIGMSSMHFAPAIGFTSASGSSIFSARIGSIADFSLNKKIYFQPGIFLSRRGQSREFSFYTSDSLNVSVQQTLTINYIDVPVNVIYKTGMQGKGRIIFGLGVTPSYIIGGRNKRYSHGAINDTPFTNNFNRQIVYRDPVAMFDFGVNIITGYELPTGLFFRAYYTAGMRDIGLSGEIDKNRIWGISAGYIFGKGRNINNEVDDLIDKSSN